MARPSEYKEEYVDKVDEYLSITVDTIEEKKVKLPTIEGFARYIGVNKTSLYEWEKKHDIFSNALDKIRQEQQQRLLDNGLAGTYNPTIAKLVLSANHGMREKQDVTTDGKELPTPLLNVLDYIRNEEGGTNEEKD